MHANSVVLFSPIDEKKKRTNKCQGNVNRWEPFHSSELKRESHIQILTHSTFFHSSNEPVKIWGKLPLCHSHTWL